MTTTTPATIAPQAAAPAWGSAVATGAGTGDVGIDFAALLFELGASPEMGVSAEVPIAVDARDAADVEPDESAQAAPLPVWPLELPPLPAPAAPLPAATEQEPAVAMPATLLAQAARVPTAATTIDAAVDTETATLPEPASAAPLPAPAMTPVASRGAARFTSAHDAASAPSIEPTEAPPTVSSPSLPSFSAAPEHGARDATASIGAPALPSPSHSLNGPMAHPAYTAPAPALAAVTIAAPLGSPEFAPALAAQVTVLARDGGIQQAELKLNPAEMGPISVRIEVNEGTLTTVHFAADVATTRDVLEASLPELAGALREAGLTLVGGGVSQHAQQSHHGRRDADGAAPGDRSRRDGREGDAGADPHAQAPRRSRGVVDLVA